MEGGWIVEQMGKFTMYLQRQAKRSQTNLPSAAWKDRATGRASLDVARQGLSYTTGRVTAGALRCRYGRSL